MGNWKKALKVAEFLVGVALVLPFEDAATGGLTMPATAGVGSVMIADAFGVKVPL